MSHHLVRHIDQQLTVDEPRSADAVIEEIVHAKRFLDAVNPGPTVVTHIEEVRRHYLDFVDRLSEHARLALLQVTHRGAEYKNALGVVSEKMHQFHQVGRDLLTTVRNRSREAFTQVDCELFIRDLGVYLAPLQIAGSTVTQQQRQNFALDVAYGNFTFGQVQEQRVNQYSSETFIARFSKAFTRDEADYLVLYVLVLDDTNDRRSCIEKVVDRVLGNMKTALPEKENAALVDRIADFIGTVRRGKNPYTLSIGEGAISGTLPEIATLDVNKPAESIRTWMANRARANGQSNGNATAAGSSSRLPYLPLIEADPRYIQGTMLVYWNNGVIDEHRMENEESVQELIKDVQIVRKSHPGLQCVGCYFYDKHALEKTLLLLPRKAMVQLRLRGTNKICSIVRGSEGSLEIQNLFGNPPPELMDVTQEEILNNPYQYFSMKEITLDHGENT